MQIVLKRIAKKKTYTIGRLYILKDEDVKKRTIESVNKCRGAEDGVRGACGEAECGLVFL